MEHIYVRAPGNDGSSHMLYHYEPTLAAAVLFVALFGLALVVHVYQMARSKTWFMIPFIVGIIFETIGYLARTISATENPGPYSNGAFIAQTVLLLIAPAFFAASIYMELGRIVLMIHGDGALFVRRTWLTKMFVTGDVASFLLQGAGGGLISSSNPNTSHLGKTIIVVGLFCQIVFFGLFVLAAAIFHLRMAKRPTDLAKARPWKKNMTGLYIVSILIFVRSIVRVVEFIEGFNGYIEDHEAFLYVFDAAPMFAAVVTMILIHPGKIATFVREAKGESRSTIDQRKV